MDYTNSALVFRIQKVARYVRLYGPRRTLAKVRAQYHMRKRYAALPPLRPGDPRQRIGIIGCGAFAFSTLAYYVRKHLGDAIVACSDTDINRAASLFEHYGAAYYTTDSLALIADPRIELIFIASNHASHADYAIAALDLAKAVHIEKPHAVTRGQLKRLCQAMRRPGSRVSLGFNRPLSSLGIRVKSILDAQEGPAVYNWFIAGHQISPDHWYFQEAEGGRLLGNLCHWTDFIYQLVEPRDRYPLTIKPCAAGRNASDVAVSYIFGNGTIAAITFSAKGHTFEGVRERFSAHRGDVLITLDDFSTLLVETGKRRELTRLTFRDHGHEASVVRSCRMLEPTPTDSTNATVSYVWETGELFLRTKEALDTGNDVTLHRYDASVLDGDSSP